ncbi:response regulator transcription factor [Streptomyces sp. UNOC14_S4]|uniref:response regulator transcription factor n=1 Tax=Streptomyces sp. UNOC14_S4 TaxID=2872340 RepID=UPI001E4A20AF|nr:response regulator transcription factor [Streptomyces sp. UNOC14_S4]MCC3772898.1 response regulator transcription factor [Streptomyces sp. UNOC14_S4]
MTRVLVVDGLRLLRHALVVALGAEADIEVVAEAASADEVAHAAVRARPDVAVVDAALLGRHAAAAIARLRRAMPRCRLLLLAGADCPAVVRAALRGGVGGLLGRDVPLAVLIGSIRRVAAGGRVLDPDIMAGALLAESSPLTRRESEVLDLAAQGHAPGGIAVTLHLAPGTVRNHLAAITGKLKARSRADAIRIARDNGWL